MDGIQPFSNVRTFFVELVTEAMRDLRVETRAETQKYLINLLSAFSVSASSQALSEPLSLLLRRALDATGPDRLARLRELGDAALFICGFFPDSFDRRGLSRTYVVEVGGRAYLVVGQAAQAHAPAEVFVELGGRFDAMARVLDEVRERTALCTDREIVKLYERWCQSGSPTLENRLRRRGVNPERPRKRSGSLN
jgi:hypothetical protein